MLQLWEGWAHSRDVMAKKKKDDGAKDRETLTAPKEEKSKDAKFLMVAQDDHWGEHDTMLFDTCATRHMIAHREFSMTCNPLLSQPFSVVVVSFMTF
jgi:hypothetical protein